MLPKDATCVEIGVFSGDFSEKLLKQTKPKTLHLIDPWKINKAKNEFHAPFGAGGGLNQAKMNKLYDFVVKRFGKYIEDGKVVVHRGTSAKILSKFPDNSLDWVYIDGDHLYSSVKKDINLSHKKVKNGGIISGDDYGSDDWHSWIKHAVDEFVMEGKCKKVVIKNKQFVLLNVK